MTEIAPPPEKLLRCSVVIPTWQRPDLLRDTLHSIVRQTYRNFEVIVVSDGEDATLHSLASELEPGYPLRWFFNPNNMGQAGARNTGAREASGEILLFLDDDVEADPELIARHLDLHSVADERWQLAVGGRIAEDRREPFLHHTDRFLQESWERTLDSFATRLTAFGIASIGEDVERAVSFGLNCSIRREVFLESGGFDPSIRITNEDMELGLRLYLAGVEFVYESRAVVTHQSTKDLTTYFRRCWSAGGKVDVHRVFELGQKNAQTLKLASIHHGYWLNRLTARFFWHTSNSLRAVAEQIEKATNRSGSRLLFGAWGRTCQQAEYWSGAKAAGCTLERLKSVVGPSKRALMLHSICEPLSKEEASYYIAPRRFKDLMRRFQRMGYKTATTAQWLQDKTPGNLVLLTFDDGYDDLYNELLPLVIEHGYTPVIYLVVDRIGATNVWDQQSGLRARNLLTLEQIREMQKHGVEFGSHTLTHPWLPGVSDAEMRREVGDSKRRLEDMLGTAVNSFAYPSGGVDRRVRSAVAAAGYKLAFTTLPGMNWWNDPLCQRRAEINDRTTALDFAFKLRTGFGFTESISNRLRSLERDMPTTALRKLVRGVRGIGREVVHMFARDTRYDSES